MKVINENDLTGTERDVKFKESCYCIQGKGILTNLTTEKEYKINVGDIYILDNHDNHTFESLEDVILISVFNPPIKGNEIHQKDGSYKINNNY